MRRHTKEMALMRDTRIAADKGEQRGSGFRFRDALEQHPVINRSDAYPVCSVMVQNAEKIVHKFCVRLLHHARSVSII